MVRARPSFRTNCITFGYRQVGYAQCLAQRCKGRERQCGDRLLTEQLRKAKRSKEQWTTKRLFRAAKLLFKLFSEFGRLLATDRKLAIHSWWIASEVMDAFWIGQLVAAFDSFSASECANTGADVAKCFAEETKANRQSHTMKQKSTSTLDPVKPILFPNESK